MYKIASTGRFKKDLKTAIKRGYDIQLLENIVAIIVSGEALPSNNNDHSLIGNWVGHRECHIAPDWLLVYKLDKDVLILTLTRTGSHSDLF